MGQIVRALIGGGIVEETPDGAPEGLDESFGGFARQRFEFGDRAARLRPCG